MTLSHRRVRISRDQFGPIVTWLMLHREGLSVLVHPYTEDRVADHSDRALWLGRRLAINIGFLKRPAKPAGRRLRRVKGVLR